MKLKKPYTIVLILAGVAVLSYVALVGARIISYTNGYFGTGAGDLALMESIARGDRTVARLMLVIGVKPDTVQPATGHSPLSGAAYQGDIWAVRKLLEAGADPNGVGQVLDNFSDPYVVPSWADNTGYPPPHVYLLDRPLCMAARAGNHETAALLREHGARYEFVDALFLADEPFVREALEKDGELAETLNRVGPRMLNLAIDEDNVPAAKLMIDLGVDPARKPEYGPSPLETAQLRQRPELVALFEGYQDRVPARE